MSFNKFIAVLWMIAAASVGVILFPLLTIYFHNNPQTWFAIALATAVFVYAVYMARAEWTRPAPGKPAAMDNPSARAALEAGMPDTAPPKPSDAAGLQDKLSSVFERVPLEKQIGEFAAAGLAMLPGRTAEELLISWPREEYETDPYQLLLFSYAGPVEREPFDEWFTSAGWNWDTECIGEPGSYVTVLREMERITGEHLFTALSDTAHYAASGTGEITYALKGGPEKTVPVDLNHDWADVMAVAEILYDIKNSVNDGREFWQGDNGQAILVYFIRPETAAAINKLKSGLLLRMV